MLWSNKILSLSLSSATGTLGFLRRNLNIDYTQMKTMAYKTLVWPLLEYACSVCDPYTQKGICQIEKVQGQSAHYVLNHHRNSSSPTEILKELGWLSLEKWHRQQRLTMSFKIVNGIVAIDAEQYLTPLFHSQIAIPSLSSICCSTLKYRLSTILIFYTYS